ncbi:MAG: hypothetical protein BLM47_03780 [Candidatus Reconcilbacillus cellulovorans]|uniref:Uncharacterized protein n=1 Tax=Candidatus Reconcilbacillus cellulovorans TaxID=1906605 RepID=A0A2A6E2S8_9BACL|nr:MAG: hypothetical protein BLM47_03780 [Candidatus Reconcilbacillus cellulovorans]
MEPITYPVYDPGYYSPQNGWIPFETFALGVSRSADKAQNELAAPCQGGFRMCIRSLSIDAPLEMHVDPASGVTSVISPSAAARLDSTFREEWLARVRLELGLRPV